MNIEVDTIKPDDPENKSLETLQIRCRLTPREIERLDQLRKGESAVQYVRRCLNLDRMPEAMEEDLRNQAAADKSFPVAGVQVA